MNNLNNIFNYDLNYFFKHLKKNYIRYIKISIIIYTIYVFVYGFSEIIIKWEILTESSELSNPDHTEEQFYYYYPLILISYIITYGSLLFIFCKKFYKSKLNLVGTLFIGFLINSFTTIFVILFQYQATTGNGIISWSLDIFLLLKNRIKDFFIKKVPFPKNSFS